MSPSEVQAILGAITILLAGAGSYAGIRVANARNAALITALQTSFDGLLASMNRQFDGIEKNMGERLDALERSVEKTLADHGQRLLRLEGAYFRLHNEPEEVPQGRR